MTPDLFGETPLPGLATHADLVSPAEERDLIARIDAQNLKPFRYREWTGRRVTTSFGLHYDFEGGRLAAAPPMPGWLAPIRDRAAESFGLDRDELVQALLIRYDPGAGIGWHRDRPVFEDVVGLSLGSPAEMRFRRRVPRGFARRAVPLDPRAAYRLGGEARHEWEHGIAEMASPRWSITFRSLSR